LLQTKDKSGEDVFFSRHGDEITFLMTCKTAEQVNYPSCEQHFPYRGARIKLWFQRTKIADWMAIRGGTINLLDGFVKAASKQGEE
jgi:hypothetical protein